MSVCLGYKLVTTSSTASLKKTMLLGFNIKIAKQARATAVNCPTRHVVNFVTFLESEARFDGLLFWISEPNQDSTQIGAAESMTGKLNCVVVAVDGSDESMNALQWALDNLKLRLATESPSGSFVILHVQSPPSIVTGINPGNIPFGGPTDLEVPAFTAAIEAHQRRITQAILDHALDICAKHNANVTTEVAVGDPKETICENAEKLHADLLVMGSRAFGPIKRMFLGSVSNYCTNHAHCPVVIVKNSTAS